MKRKAIFFFSSFLLLCGILCFFRYQTLVLCTKWFFKKPFTYQEISTSEEKIHIQGLHFSKDQIDISLDGVKFGIEFKKLFQHPKRFLSLYRHGITNWNDLFIPMKQYGLNLDVQRGVLTLGEQRYFFHFKHGEKKHEIGTLFVFDDTSLIDHPFLILKFHVRGDQLISQLTIEEVPSERLLHLAAFSLPQYFIGFTQPSGNIQLQANVIFEENGQIDEVSTRFKTENFSIEHPEKDLAIKLGSLTGEINYPEGIEESDLPIWKKMQCILAMEDGSLRFGKHFFLSRMQGNLALDTREHPSLTLTGELAGQNKPLFLELKGKGAVHEDHAYWLEFALGLNDLEGTKCDAFISVCRPELESLVTQIEANHLLPQQVEMLKGYLSRFMPRLKEWHVLQGHFGGKLVALFEKGNLSHFEIQNFTGEKVVLSSGKDPLFFRYVKGEGRLFSDLNFTFELPISHLFGMISPELQDAYGQFQSDAYAHVNTTVQFGKKEVETRASISFLELEESLQFGFKSSRPFPSSLQEITEGWARCEKLSFDLYSPFIHCIFEDLQVYGDLDVLVSFNGKVVDCALQVDHFLVKHPFLDIKATAIGEKETTVGRIRFCYDPFSHTFDGTIPLRNAQGYDRQYGLFFTNVEGDVHISPEKFSGHIAHADMSLDGINLVKNMNFSFSYDQYFDFQEIHGDLALPTTYHIHFSELNPSSCKLSLFEEKKELLQLQAHFIDSWKGEMKCFALKGSFPFSFSWNPIADFASLEISQNNLNPLSESKTDSSFACTIKKDKDQYIVENSKIGPVEGQMTFTLNKDRADVSFLQLQTAQGLFSGSGDIHIQWPEKGEKFGLFGEMIYQLQSNVFVPLELKGQQPLKWAFSPEMGFVFSEIDCMSHENQIQLDHLEYLLGKDKIAANNLQFCLSENLVHQMFDEHSLPSFLQDFRVCKELLGKVHLEVEKGTTKAHGTLQSNKGNLGIDAQWDGKKGTFSIGDEEKLTFHMHKEEEVQFDAIKGSFGRMQADLKRVGNHLKGVVHLDFSLIDELFDLPLNAITRLWQAKGGYRFEGIFHPARRLLDWGFKGKIKGDGFECGGYQLRSLEAKVEVEPGQITIENLDLTDDSGKLWVSEGALMRAGQSKKWIFAFPLVEIRSFQPSFMRKIAGPETPISPLIVKSATIHDVRGRIDEPTTITGKGELRFTNIAKKGEGKLPQNLPTQLLEQMGLDGHLFVPASGEISYSIQNGRIYLTEIQNMISEKNRSEFLPPKSGVMGYLDFHGNFFIDLVVRQKAVRSISTPLSLKVRGTWDEPQMQIK